MGTILGQCNIPPTRATNKCKFIINKHNRGTMCRDPPKKWGKLVQIKKWFLVADYSGVIT